MLLWHFSNYTFMPTISFDYNKEDKARKMLQCHLLGERSRNLLILGPQQQLTMFLLMMTGKAGISLHHTLLSDKVQAEVFPP